MNVNNMQIGNFQRETFNTKAKQSRITTQENKQNLLPGVAVRSRDNELY